MSALTWNFVLAAICVTASAQSKPQAAAEQRFFNIEDAIQHRVELSDTELSLLAHDDLMRAQLHQEARIAQDGLEAAEVHLCGASERDLVIIGDGPQFSGANVGPFWIIRDLASGPMVVLSEVSLGLTIDTKRSNKCYNVEAIASTATQVTTTEFHFNGEEYTIFRQNSENASK
jgi:hypothetical protein